MRSDCVTANFGSSQANERLDVDEHPWSAGLVCHDITGDQ